MKKTETKREQKRAQREHFARLVAQGTEPAEAYKIANHKPNASRRAALQGSEKWMKEKNARMKLEELTAAADRSAIMTREERMRELTRRIEALRASDDPRSIKAAVACIAELNRMDGSYAPAQVEVRHDAVAEFAALQMQQASAEPLVRSAGRIERRAALDDALEVATVTHEIAADEIEPLVRTR